MGDKEWRVTQVIKPATIAGVGVEQKSPHRVEPIRKL
jgi:hypothetical protein